MGILDLFSSIRVLALLTMTIIRIPGPFSPAFDFSIDPTLTGIDPTFFSSRVENWNETS